MLDSIISTLVPIIKITPWNDTWSKKYTCDHTIVYWINAKNVPIVATSRVLSYYKTILICPCVFFFYQSAFLA